jgi:hypothetical protein
MSLRVCVPAGNSRMEHPLERCRIRRPYHDGPDEPGRTPWALQHPLQNSLNSHMLSEFNATFLWVMFTFQDAKSAWVRGIRRRWVMAGSE